MTDSSVEPMFTAALAIASKNPRERSSGVVGDFPVVIRPPSCMIVQSVNVPPMSTPTDSPALVMPSPGRAG